MPTKESKELLKSIEKLGFDHIWTNGKGFLCYAHPDDPEQEELSINQSINHEQTSKNLLRRAQKIAKALPKVEKRKGQQVKERQAAERERAQQRLAWAEKKRERLLAEQAEADHIAKIQELIEHRRAELLALHREMTDTPQGSQHRGRGRAEFQGTTANRTPL